MELKALLELRASIKKEMDRLNALNLQEGRAWSADDQTAWDKAKADFAECQRKISIAQETADADTAVNPQRAAPIGRPDSNPSNPAGGNGGNRDSREDGPSEEHRALAIQAWFLRNITAPRDLADRHVEACRSVGINPDARELCFTLPGTPQARQIQEAWRSGGRAFAEGRALSAITGSTGGVITMPQSMVQQLEVNLLKYGGVLDVCEVIRTDGRERMRLPTVNDTSNKGRRIGEAKAVAELNPTFGAVYWDAYKYTSDEILTPYELLTGTPYNLPFVLGEMMFERIARKLSDDFTTGTGVNQPAGIVTKATSCSAASATAIAWDDLETLITAVDPSHRIGANFSFHDNIRSALMKLKDGNGRPYWADGPNGSAPPTLKGYSWTINQSMDSTIASGKKTILFGNHRKYKVRMVGLWRMYRLIERYRENDEDAFLSFLEADGNLLDAGTAPLKYLAH